MYTIVNMFLNNELRKFLLRAARSGMGWSFLAAACATAGWGETAAERGKYLVDEVAKCGDCHTPTVEGKPDTAKYLKGAVLTFQPIGEVKGWHKTSPDLTPAGRLWMKWGEKGLTNFLVTGKGPSGHAADAPMPTYTLKQDDAEAIVQYLKSLK